MKIFLVQEDLDDDKNPDKENPGETQNNDFSFTHTIFLELQNNTNKAMRHRGIYQVTWDKINNLKGHEEVARSSSNGEITWQVVESVPDDVFGRSKQGK